MLVLRSESANELYAAACRAVLEEGRHSSPRGLETVEVLGAHLCLSDPRRRYVDVQPARVINPAFAVAEAIWILSGSDAPWIFRYNRALAQYADDGRLQGAYGPRMRSWRGKVDQLDHVRRLLVRDPHSRQAVIQLFDPERDTVGHRDVPCTLGYRFFLREGRLHMHTTMRSQDLWLGFPYDIFTTTILQELLAGWLGVEVGEYHHHVDSLHLYDQHLSGAREVAKEPTSQTVAMPPVEIPWESLPDVLSAVVEGNPTPFASPIWTTFTHMLASYRAWNDGQAEKARRLLIGLPDDLSLAMIRWYDRLVHNS